ncbi:MAG: nitroreductase family protein, partial [Mangrovicoccus sp.]|nr:nitroreductase family protein [Mangrovicoccus sp.]
LGRPALARLSALVSEIGAARGRDPADTAKLAEIYGRSGCAVVVVESPKPSPKIPLVEQTYSTGAVCLALLNAALASGWGATWLTGWAAYDREFLSRGLGLDEHERMAGIIHIGTETAIPPDRPRPDLAAITSWVDA